MIKFIDLFAGMGGTRIGFEQGCEDLGFESECVFTSEIKPYAVNIYRHNFMDEEVHGDITQIDENALPDFDFLLGGFPCQAFSSAGKRHGFNDARGTLFFDIARIIKNKKPRGFILENVEGLVKHDLLNKNDSIGNTLQTILDILVNLGYNVTWKVLNSIHFGTPQARKRIYIIGSIISEVNLENFVARKSVLGNVLEQGVSSESTVFRERLLSLYPVVELYGKAIKDKRGGKDNIHSWDLELKGPISNEQKLLMSQLLKERRKKKWATEIGIDWMDGMPLTAKQIHTFYNKIEINQLTELLDDLVSKSYLKFEHPKQLVKLNQGTTTRVSDSSKPKGYNIVTGKLSFELNKILDPRSTVNTLVATEVDRIGVIDQGSIRNLTNRECLRLFGFPEDYQVNIQQKELYDLIGNTVVVPVVRAVSRRLLEVAYDNIS